MRCALVEARESAWYYIIEDWGAPPGAPDWRAHATAFGPYATKDAAGRQMHAQLHDPHPYPGLWPVVRYLEYRHLRFTDVQAYEGLVRRALHPVVAQQA